MTPATPLTMANVVIVSLAAYRGVEYMDSVAFCGQVCHEPMEPQFVSHQFGSHARVACVDCHIGPGGRALVHAIEDGAGSGLRHRIGQCRAGGANEDVQRAGASGYGIRLVSSGNKPR